MVRLLVPEGEGQHDIVRRPIATNIRIAPELSSIAALALTGCLASVGWARPGTFLKIAAWISAGDISIGILDHYGRREVNRSIFKMDNVEPKPGKLWERTKHWTIDDTVIGGATAGSFLALNPRAFPGVYGWRRFLGVATVGAAIGGIVGQSILVHLPSQMRQQLRAADHTTRLAQYGRLRQNSEAMSSLSRFGKMALPVYTWSLLILASSAPATSGNAAAQGASSVHENPHLGISQEEIDRTTVVQVEFNNGELRGPDVEQGYRVYKDTLADRDVNELQDWLEQLQETRKQTAIEAQYMWQHLSTKEEAFYGSGADEREKDVLRREIQLLNNMCGDFCARDTILSYHIADALKRLHQVEKKPIAESPPILSKATPSEAPSDVQQPYPHLVAEQIRMNWQRQKQVLSMLEEGVELHKNISTDAGSQQEAHFQLLQGQLESMKKNVEATEKLLKHFEEQLQKTDERVKP